MKVKVVKACVDTITKAPYAVGSIIELTDSRALKGIKNGYLKEVEEAKPEKKTRKKKEVE